MRFALVLAALLLAISPAGAQVFPVPGPGHFPWAAGGGGGEPVVNGRPPLLDLYATMDARIPAIGGDAIEAWADARDTVAELAALPGWTVVNVAPNDCANNATQDTALATELAAAPAKTVLFLNGTAPCHYNTTAALSKLNTSDVLIVGRGMDSTFIDSDIPVVSNNGSIGILFGASGAFSLFEATTFTWASGFAIGTTSLGVTDAAGGDEIDVGERISLEAQDSQGSTIAWTSIVASVSGSAPNKTVVIEDPLPTDASSTGAQIKIYKAKDTSSGWVDNVGLMDLTFDQTQSARVSDANAQAAGCITSPSAECPWFGEAPIEFRNVHRARIERVHFPHAFNKFVSLHGGSTNGNASRAIVRSSKFGENYLAYNRGNNNATFSQGSPHSVGHYIVNSVLGARSVRMFTFEGSGQIAPTGNAVAWNYQPPMDNIDGWPHGGAAPTACESGGGRSLFMGHADDDTPFVANLVEGNDFSCHVEWETATAGSHGLRNVHYRNRLVKHTTGTTGFVSQSASYLTHATLILNRVRRLVSNGAGPFAGNASDLWMSYNAAEVTCNLGANGASGGCAGDGSNYLDDTYLGNVLSTSAVTVTSSAAYPPSFLLSGPPSWWCQEACSWLDTAGPGAAEANTGGALCKTPAQILHEGGTCTPCALNPAACLD